MKGGVEVCRPSDTILINKVEDKVVTVKRTPNGTRASWRQPSGGTYEHPALDPHVDELPPLPDGVIYRIAAILHHHSEEESGSKAESLDAMHTGHPAQI
jgi:hypothetical protein